MAKRHWEPPSSGPTPRFYAGGRLFRDPSRFGDKYDGRGTWMPAGPSERPGSRPKRALTAQLQSGVCACAFRPWNVYEMPPRGGTPYDSSTSPRGGIRGSISYKVGYRVRRNKYCGALYRCILQTALEMR